MSPAVAAAGLTFTYASRSEPQLHGVTFTVEPGERVAVMGATGAGKTTLMLALNGLVPHHHEGKWEGALIVSGLEVSTTAVTDLVRHVGLVMQDPEAQITGRTVIDDVAVGPANLGLPRHEVMSRAAEALAQVGIAHLLHQPTNQLSGGELQRLAVAGILAMHPEIVVLDEPTSELDPAGAEQLFDVVSALARDSGRTVLLVAHEPELVAAWADRLLVLRRGRIIFDGDPRSFFADAEAVAHAGLRAPGVTKAVQALAATGHIEAPASVPITLAEGLATLAGAVPAPSGIPSQSEAPLPRAEVRPLGEVVIDARELTYRYPSGVLALDGVSVQVCEGEFVALLGSNGAGKSTFARHLNGLLRPTSGELIVNGRRTAGRQVSELAREVGFVFQNPDHQIFATSVADEIAFGMRNLGIPEETIAERITNVLGLVGLPGVAHLHPYRLGKGQRQRLAVAAVLALEPRILVIDEPTTGQDWTGAVAVMELVAELNRAGHTIVLITHDPMLAARYARRAIVLDHGRVRADRPILDVYADRALLTETQLRPPQVCELAMELGLGPVRSIQEFTNVWVSHDAR